MGVLLEIGNRNAPPFRIRMGIAARGKAARITEGALDEIKRECRQPVIGVSNAGVHIPDGIVSSPFVFCQNPRGSIFRLFISVREREAMGQNFQVSKEDLSYGIFTFQFEGAGVRRSGVLMPQWEYMLDPHWAGSFRRWISRPKASPLPDPVSFPWPIDESGQLLMPLIWERFQVCRNGEGDGKGRMGLLVAQGRAMADFTFGRMRTAQFLLSPDQAERVRLKGSPGETFINEELRALFGKKPAATEYCFSRCAGKDELSLGNVHGAKLFASSRINFPFIAGEIYYFKAFRKGNRVELCYCADDSYSDKSYLGKAILPLTEDGFLLTHSISFAPVG